MARRSFTPAEVWSFQEEVARGAKQADVARKDAFSVSNFRRWFVKYGRPIIPYEPTDADRAGARAWRKGRTLTKAWTMYEEFAKSGPWADDAELPVFDDVDERPDEYEHLQLKARPDARVVLVCEKMHVERLLYEWKGRADPASPTRRRRLWRGCRRSRAYKMLEQGTKMEADALRGRPFLEELGRRLRSVGARHGNRRFGS